jgi:hypothetical protein
MPPLPLAAPLAPLNRVEPERDGGGDGLRTAGFVVGGIGVASAIGFAITAVMIVDADGVASDDCTPICRQEGLDAIERGEGLLPINAVFTVVGALGLVGGAVLLVAAEANEPAASARRVRLRTTAVGALADGRF